MRRMRGVMVGDDPDTKWRTILIIYADGKAWLRLSREQDDIAVTREEVEELSRCFRNCLDLWKE